MEMVFSTCFPCETGTSRCVSKNMKPYAPLVQHLLRSCSPVVMMVLVTFHCGQRLLIGKCWSLSLVQRVICFIKANYKDIIGNKYKLWQLLCTPFLRTAISCEFFPFEVLR